MTGMRLHTYVKNQLNVGGPISTSPSVNRHRNTLNINRVDCQQNTTVFVSTMIYAETVRCFMAIHIHKAHHIQQMDRIGLEVHQHFSDRDALLQLI